MNTQKNSASTFPYFGHKEESIHRYLKAYNDPKIGPRISANDKNSVFTGSIEDAKETTGALVCFKSKTKEIIPSGTTITGMVVGIAFRNHITYRNNNDKHGKNTNYIDLKILEENKDNGELNKLPSVITFGTQSAFGTRLIGLLNSLDLSNKIDFVLNVALKGQKLGDTVLNRDMVFPTIRKSRSAEEKSNTKMAPVWAKGRLNIPKLPKSKSGKSNPDEGVISEINEIILDTVFEIHEKIIQNKSVEKATENQSDFTGRIKLKLKSRSEDEVKVERPKY